jgi:hypothetical protein
VGGRARVRFAASKVGTRWATSRAGIGWAALPPRTKRIAAGECACVLILVIIAGLVFGPFSGHRANGPVATPAIAAASAPLPSETDSSSALPDTSSAPSATVDFSPRAPNVLASIRDCSPDAAPTPVTSGGRLYVSCDAWTKIVAIDLATDTVAKIYTISDTPYDMESRFDRVVVDQDLWLNTAVGAERLDLTTGAILTQFKGMRMVGEFSGTLLMVDADGNLVHVNPATAKKSAWSAPSVANELMKLQDDPTSNYEVVACGMIWIWGMGSDSIDRLNPANGKVTDMGNANVAGWPMDVVQLGDTCWAVLRAKSGDVVLARLGTSCADMVTSDFDGNADWWVVGDTLWLTVLVQSAALGYPTALVQFEPFGGKKGRIWEVPVGVGGDGWITSAGGQVWVGNATESAGLTRVDIPLDQMTPGPTPKTLACVAPKASPSPSASATPTATASATPTATATTSPSPSPSGTDSPTPTPTPETSASDSTAP